TVGPIVEILVGPSHAFRQSLVQRGEQVPTAQRVIAMVDTGAGASVLVPGVAQALDLSPIGMVEMSTPSTTTPVSTLQYDVSLSFPNGVEIDSVGCIEAPLGGQHIQCLIGRDVLRQAVLVYIGETDQFTLSF
ncbi:MAG: hypothetical protein GY716_12755, partial [bacterium]|nr:hypothetical protein [bacterium]